MKQLNIILALTYFFLLPIPLTSFATESRAEPYLTKQFTLNGAGNLNVETSGSSVAVTGSGGNEVVVAMYVKLDGREIEKQDPAVEKELEDYNIDIRKDGNTVSVIVKRKTRVGRNKLNLSFKIQVASEMSSKFQSAGGSISIEGIKGNHSVTSSGGSIQVANSGGELTTQSAGGSFRLENFDGKVNVQSSGGSIKANRLTGDLKVGSSGGSVSLEEIAGSINVNSSGGSVKAQLSKLEKELNLNTSGGSITAIVPRGQGLNLNLSGGRVNSSLSNFDGEIKKDRIFGKINGGGVPVVMQSSGGSITLEFN